jgi:hypothetical protein
LTSKKCFKTATTERGQTAWLRFQPIEGRKAELSVTVSNFSTSQKHQCL